MSYQACTINQLNSLLGVYNHLEVFEEAQKVITELIQRPDWVMDDSFQNGFIKAFEHDIKVLRDAYRYSVAPEIIEMYSQIENSLDCGLLKTNIVVKLTDKLTDLIDKIEKFILNKCETGQTKVFFHKLIGDYYRYLCELGHIESYKNAGYSAYNKAKEIATETLPICDVYYIGLILNFSIFHQEIMGDTATAIEMGSETFADAYEMIESGEGDIADGADYVLTLLKRNIDSWRFATND
eukprot:TRINITY_DN1821_c0_g1_i1.p1 TRINITY_DN1821_c0_g1~~TRINITY_DN1821_c0_g1_i1.p1  ORF type:complete len:248 (+),score=82.90 TRINITY_DN1821_c0_g1_i1:29-745(+)